MQIGHFEDPFDLREEPGKHPEIAASHSDQPRRGHLRFCSAVWSLLKSLVLLLLGPQAAVRPTS
jgi:hypothetical protein